MFGIWEWGLGMTKKPNDYMVCTSKQYGSHAPACPCKFFLSKFDACCIKLENWFKQAGLKHVYLDQSMSVAASLLCPQRWSPRAGAPLSCALRPQLTCRVFHGHALWSSNVSHFPSWDSPLRHNWASFEEWTCWDGFLFRVSWHMFARWTKVLLVRREILVWWQLGPNSRSRSLINLTNL